MREIMKKTMLLVIFSVVLTFWATLAFAAVDEPLPAGSDEEVVIVISGGLEDDNEGDPDGYKEGWDVADLSGLPGGPVFLNVPWERLIAMYLVLSVQRPF